MRVEVRAARLKELREKRGLTRRKLAHELGISQNYIPAIEGGARRAGPKLQEQMVKYFGCRFEEPSIYSPSRPIVCLEANRV